MAGGSPKRRGSATRSWSTRWGPVVGGLALLMFTGTGDENTDIGAHLMGFVCGFGYPELAAKLKPAEKIYVALLSMCLLPILVSALIWGVGQILRARETQALFGAPPLRAETISTSAPPRFRPATSEASEFSQSSRKVPDCMSTKSEDPIFTTTRLAASILRS